MKMKEKEKKERGEKRNNGSSGRARRRKAVIFTGLTCVFVCGFVFAAVGAPPPTAAGAEGAEGGGGAGGGKTWYVDDDGSTNAWDNGTTDGGNYWSDHACTGNPSDGSEPYEIDADSTDRYPFEDVSGWAAPPPPPKPAVTIATDKTEYSPSGKGKTIGYFTVSGDEICLEERKPIVYFFGSEGCGYCKWEHPVFLSVTSRFGDFISLHDNMGNFSADKEIFEKYNPFGGIPLLVLGCKYYRLGAGISIGEEQEAKVLTALICDLTDSKPVEVCTDPEIEALMKKNTMNLTDEMKITIGLKNPTSSPVNAYFVWNLSLPEYGYEWTMMVVPLAPLPAEFEQCYNFSLLIPDWGAVGFNASWTVALLEETAPYETICEDTADWRYVPAGAGRGVVEGEGGVKPAEVGEELQRRVEEEGVELPF